MNASNNITYEAATSSQSRECLAAPAGVETPKKPWLRMGSSTITADSQSASPIAKGNIIPWVGRCRRLAAVPTSPPLPIHPAAIMERIRGLVASWKVPMMPAAIAAGIRDVTISWMSCGGEGTPSSRPRATESSPAAALASDPAMKPRSLLFLAQ